MEFSHTVSRAPRRSPPFAALCGWVLLCFLATTAVHAETTLIIRDGELRFQNSDGSQFAFRPLYADLDGKLTTPQGQTHEALFKQTP